MILSQSVVGITHIGADVGGFFGNPDAQLLCRWYQVSPSYVLPFFSTVYKAQLRAIFY